MKCRTISTVVAFVGLLVCLSAQPALADQMQVVVKYGGALVKVPGAPAHDGFRGMVMPNGPVLIFLLPNKAVAQGKPEIYDPQDAMEGTIKPLHAGDFLQVTFTPPNGRGPILLETTTVYTAKPGETDPHAFVYVEEFDHKVGQQTISAITLSKFLQKATYLVPTHRDDSGDMVPDEVILGIAAHLQPNDLVYAVTMGSGNNMIVKLLAPWKNHFTGKFVKLDPNATVDSNGDTGPAVELTGPDGKAVTALIPGAVLGKRWTPDPNILAAARGMKPDADVDYITADSGDKRNWLMSISRSKPPEKSASAGHGSNNE